MPPPPSPPTKYIDPVGANTFEAVIQSTLTTCTGERLCLEEVSVNGEIFIGVGTRCEERFRWVAQLYEPLTEQEHYGRAQNGTVPAETQKWVIKSKSGCLKQLRYYYPWNQGVGEGDRLGVDPACEVGHDTEFWGLASPLHVDETLDGVTEAFSIVESHVNHTRRGVYYVNATTPYTTSEGQNCTCVNPAADPLSALLRMQTHLHLRHPTPERDYFAVRDACDGHVFNTVIFPPSPPPPVLDDNNNDPPPAPPYYLHEVKAATGAVATTGMFFFGFCACCATLGLTTAVRGRDRGKWWGSREMAIERPTAGPLDGRYGFSVGGTGDTGVFLGALPPSVRRVDPARESLLAL